MLLTTFTPQTREACCRGSHTNLLMSCRGLDVCVPPNPYVETLTPIVVGLGCGALGKGRGSHEVMKVGSCVGSSTLTETGRDLGARLSP